MAEEKRIFNKTVEAPFRQQQYLELFREKIGSIQNQNRIIEPEQFDELLRMTDVLIADDTFQMGRELPEQYWAVMSQYDRIGQIGKTADPDDVWAEEPDSWIKPITKEEFESDD